MSSQQKSVDGGTLAILGAAVAGFCLILGSNQETAPPKPDSSNPGSLPPSTITSTAPAPPLVAPASPAVPVLATSSSSPYYFNDPDNLGDILESTQANIDSVAGSTSSAQLLSLLVAANPSMQSEFSGPNFNQTTLITSVQNLLQDLYLLDGTYTPPPGTWPPETTIGGTQTRLEAADTLYEDSWGADVGTPGRFLDNILAFGQMPNVGNVGPAHEGGAFTGAPMSGLTLAQFIAYYDPQEFEYITGQTLPVVADVTGLWAGSAQVSAAQWAANSANGKNDAQITSIINKVFAALAA